MPGFLEENETGVKSGKHHKGQVTNDLDVLPSFQYLHTHTLILGKKRA